MYAIVKAQRVFIPADDEYGYIAESIVQVFPTSQEADDALGLYSLFSEDCLVVVWANGELFPGAFI